MLLAIFDDNLDGLEERRVDERRLHGEPHDGNRMVTPAGVRWLDLESS